MSLWTPALLSVPPACWLKADSLSLPDGTLISSWTDSSGNSHSASGSGGTRPAFAANALNGLPGVRMDGSKQMIVAGLGDAMSGRDNYTVFMYNRVNDHSNYPIVFTHPVTGTWDWILEYEVTGGFFWGQVSPNYRMYATAVTTGVDLISVTKSSSVAGKMHKNGTEITSFSTNGSGLIAAPVMTGDMLLGQYTSAGFGLNGDMYEIIVVPSTLSDADRQLVEGYLAWKWGQQAALPGGHPYKSAAPTVADSLATFSQNSDVRMVSQQITAGATLQLSPMCVPVRPVAPTVTAAAAMCLPVFPLETYLRILTPGIFITPFDYVLSDVQIVPGYQFELNVAAEYSTELNLEQEYETCLEIQPCRNAS